MLPFRRERFGNASSRHEYGRRARQAIDEARQRSPKRSMPILRKSFYQRWLRKRTTCSSGAPPRHLSGFDWGERVEHPACSASPTASRRGWELRARWRSTSRAHRATGFEALQRAPVFALDDACQQRMRRQSRMCRRFAARRRQVGAGSHRRGAGLWQGAGRFPGARGQCDDALVAQGRHGPIGAGALVLDKRVELEPLIAGGAGARAALRDGETSPRSSVSGKACELAVQEGCRRCSERASNGGALEASGQG